MAWFDTTALMRPEGSKYRCDENSGFLEGMIHMVWAKYSFFEALEPTWKEVDVMTCSSH